MTVIVLVFGVLIFIGGLTALLKPSYIFSIFSKYGDSIGLHVFAIITRIILGIALLFAAGDSKYPLLLKILGALTLLAVIILGAIGRERFKKLIKWSLSFKPNAQRVMGFVGIIFGAFLFYAVY